jgi:hypothetical protein
MKTALDRDLTDFYDVRFLVLVPRFNTLQHQTAKRVSDQGLLYEGEKNLSLVIQYGTGVNDTLFEAFKSEVIEEKRKLENGEQVSTKT